PGDEERLRRVSATVLSGEATQEAQRVPPREEEVASTAPTKKDLLDLLDRGQGLAVLLLLAAAFGAAHALTPGHGKTLVAAYLIGERGTVWHAVVLGVVTTMTHTGMVLILAVALRLFPDSARRDLQTTLGLASGLLIAG